MRPARRLPPTARAVLIAGPVAIASLLAARAEAGGAIPANAILSGNWSNPSNWSTTPDVPNNGQPNISDRYAVTVNNKVMTLDMSATVDVLTLGHVSGITNAITNPGAIQEVLEILNSFKYSQGIISGNTKVVVGPDATMEFLALPSGQTRQLNAELVNHGTVDINFFTTLFSSGPGSAFVNEAGGTVNINNTTNFSRIAGSVDPVFVNQPGGTINQLANFSTNINWRFNNHGVVNVINSSFQASRGGNHTGSFNVGPNRTMTFGGSGFTHTLAPGSKVSGLGSATFDATTQVQCNPSDFTIANMSVNGVVTFESLSDGEFEVNVQSLSMGSGTVSGGQITANTFNWFGGEIATVVRVLNFLFANLTDNPNAPRTISGTLESHGGAHLRNMLNIDGEDGKFVNSSVVSTSQTTLINGTGTFVNNGLLNVQSGTTTIGSELETTDDSIIEVTPGAALFVAKARVLQGALAAAPGAAVELLLADHEAFAFGFALALAQGSSAAATGAKGQGEVHFDVLSDLSGTGVFTIDGRFQAFNKTRPGNSPGTLTIAATEVIFHDEHRLDMELGDPGSKQVDLLVVNGDLVLGGTLNVIALDGFSAGVYTLIQCSGAIFEAGMSIGDFPRGFSGEIEIDRGVVRLVVSRSSACSADFNSDARVDGGDLGVLLGQWGACIGCEADLNADNMVDGSDLGDLLGAWGPC